MIESIIETGPATAILPVDNRSPITVIGSRKIRTTFDEVCLQQAVNSRNAPGVSRVVLNPDGHRGYGAPIGCVMASPTHVYPGPVGVDIKCSMSLLQMDVPEDVLHEKPVRRELIRAICERIPTGAGRGQRHVKKPRIISDDLGWELLTQGASKNVLDQLGIPFEWSTRCEDAFHRGHDDSVDSLALRLDQLMHLQTLGDFSAKINQLGSYGGGNHFGECEVVEIVDEKQARHTAEVFGLRDRHIAFLSHCGSRGIGHNLAMGQFQSLQAHFSKWDIPLPGNDRELVYAPLGSQEADRYLDDMAIGANFATVNHLLINALVLEAFQEVLPGTQGQLVYFISHNIARKEWTGECLEWVHRKGATRALPAGHRALAGTNYAETGHPILLPGNPQAGSSVMVALAGCFTQLLQRQSRRGSHVGKTASEADTQSRTDRRFIRQGGYPDQL